MQQMYWSLAPAADAEDEHVMAPSCKSCQFLDGGNVRDASGKQVSWRRCCWASPEEKGQDYVRLKGRTTFPTEGIIGGKAQKTYTCGMFNKCNKHQRHVSSANVGTLSGTARVNN